MFDNIDTNDVCELRVLPYIRNETRIKNGREYKISIDNLTNKEIRNMSCQPIMLWMNDGIYFLEELPLSMKGPTSIKWSICYVFSDLSEQEQIRYIDRTITIPASSESVRKLYEEKSKSKKNSLLKKRKRSINN